jgi:phospholipid/cholesterol/gamma-HCH transport system substrate-binding protein
MKDTAILIKLACFGLVTVLSSVLIINTLTQPLSRKAISYSAVFTDAQGVTAGSDVRIAGVRVGKVDSVHLRGGMAQVDFEVEDDQHLPRDAGAIIRYADLLGARYIAMTDGKGAGGTLPAGAVIPAGRTLPAVDLTALLNGFQPLFDSIDPRQVNKLATSLIAVFQGESGTLNDLLRNVVAVTSTVTSKDAVIGRVLTNLNAVIGNMLGKRVQFTNLVNAMSTLVQTAAAERGQLGEVLDSTSQLATTLAGVTDQVGPDLTKDVRSLSGAARVIDRNGKQFPAAIRSVTGALNRLGRAGGYGSWLNMYVCNLSVSVGPAGVTVPPNVHSGVCR